MHEKKRVTKGKPVTAAPIKDAAAVAILPSGGKSGPGEVHAHAHLLPAPNSAVATKERAGNASGKAGSTDGPRPSESDEDGSRTSYHLRNLKDDREMTA
eukprot:2677747-Pyramimonas_sp.AAC.1